MTNKKSTKRALLVSAMAMVICFTMLLGTTFAWFTDSKTNSGYVVTAGTLRVNLSYSQDDGSTWKDASTGNIFEHTNWEPGYMEVRQIKIDNVGSLDFNFKLVISGTPESNITNVIDVYYIGSAITSEQIEDADRKLDTLGFTKLGTLSTVLADTDGFGNGTLLAQDDSSDDDTKTFTFALVMQGTAGNEYQGQSSGSFAVKVLATQMTSESDSVNDQYDAEPETDFPNVTDVPAAS